jgi:hypothetical protein
MTYLFVEVLLAMLPRRSRFNQASIPYPVDARRIIRATNMPDGIAQKSRATRTGFVRENIQDGKDQDTEQPGPPPQDRCRSGPHCLASCPPLIKRETRQNRIEKNQISLSLSNSLSIHQSLTMGFALTTILLATLAATMAPNPSIAVLTDVGLGKMVDMDELGVTLDYQTTHKSFGLAEAALFEKAIVEAINDVYTEDELHAYGAKVTHSSRRPAGLSEVLLQGQEDLAMLDDVEELAEEALALEALVMDNEGVTIEEVRSEISNLRGGRFPTPWWRKTWAGSTMYTVQVHCRLCAPEGNVGDGLANLSLQSKRKDTEIILGRYLKKNGFAINLPMLDFTYGGREIDPYGTVEEDHTEEGFFAPVLEEPVLAGAFAAN